MFGCKKRAVLCSVLVVVFILFLTKSAHFPQGNSAPEINKIREEVAIRVEHLESAILLRSQKYKDDLGLSGIISGGKEKSHNEEFTVLLFTFKYRRMDMVKQILAGFIGLPNLNQVLIIWSNPEVEAVQNLSLPVVDYPVRIFRTTTDSLNIRFSPLRMISTTAVFSLDDDVFLPHEPITYAFNTWKMERDRIVGFRARGVRWDVSTQKWKYDRSPAPSKVSIILTNYAFLHRRYLWLYTYTLPPAIWQWIDEKINCEDFAMNFVVSNFTGKSPLPVLEETRNLNPRLIRTGLSTGSTFNQTRDECINFFIQIYGRNALVDKSQF